MTTKALRPPMTAAKFLNMSGTEGYELVDGRIKEKAMGYEASAIGNNLSARLTVWAEYGRLGTVAGSEAIFQCFPHKPDQVRKPDVSFIRRDRLPASPLPKGACLIPPDLAAEVMSPKERAYDLSAKVDDFIRAGVPLIWVVNPDARTVTVHTGRQSITLTDADELTGDPVLPGFRVKVADLFPPAPPPAS